METISIESFGSDPGAGLKQFLEYCQATAIKAGHPILASITIPSEFLDPLAVLESVYENNQPHCYIEKRESNTSIACAEPVINASFSGPDRFQRAKAFANEWVQRSIFVGDKELPDAGPTFFCQFAFEHQLEEGGFLPPAYVFIPRWQVSWDDNTYSATANVVIDQDSPLELIFMGIWRAHSRFSSFDFNSETREVPDVSQGSLWQVEPEGENEAKFKQNVERITHEIASGEVDKVVIARSQKLSTQYQLSVFDLLNRLRYQQVNCHAFSFQNERGEIVVGASPERLVKIEGNKIYTEALAGSIGRSASMREDAQLSKALLTSEKDLRENGWVIRYIEEKLKTLGVEIAYSKRPSVFQTSQVQHLKIPVVANLGAEYRHVLDFAEVLHPTPALGGYPRKKALQYISELEPVKRGPYAGLTGWFNAAGDGEFIVNIRCGILRGNEMTLFAGAGIVENSDSGAELNETRLKMDSMLKSLQSTD